MNGSQGTFIAIGRLCRPFGIAGNIRFSSYFDQYVDFSRITDIKIGKTGEIYKVAQWVLKKPLHCKIEGIDTPEDARTLMGKDIYVPRELALPLHEDEHYVADLEHLQVVYNDKVIGRIKSVVEQVYTPLLEIELLDKKIVYIPFIKKFFASPDSQNMSIALLQPELIDNS